MEIQPKRKRSPVAEHNRKVILDTAELLFRREGVRAVGMDRIVAESGLAKMTLYRQFSTKDDLVVAYLHRCAEAFWNAVKPALGKGKDPVGCIRLFLDAVVEDATRTDSRGCPFGNTKAEFGTAEHPVHAVARAHAQQVQALLTELALSAQLENPKGLAEKLMLVIDGVYATAQTLGRRGPPASAQSLVDAIIAQHSVADARVKTKVRRA